ncbi:hypothetical protein L204_100517 [Cryptococcus depauperatus]
MCLSYEASNERSSTCMKDAERVADEVEVTTRIASDTPPNAMGCLNLETVYRPYLNMFTDAILKHSVTGLDWRTQPMSLITIANMVAFAFGEIDVDFSILINLSMIHLM